MASPSLTRFFGGPPAWVLIRLAFLSLILGLIFSVLHIDPLDIVDWVQEVVVDIYEMGFEAVEKLGRYFLLGAIIVFPAWLVIRALKFLGGGKSSAARQAREQE